MTIWSVRIGHVTFSRVGFCFRSGHGCVPSNGLLWHRLPYKCGPFLTSSTEVFNFYGFVSRVKDMNKTFHDTSVGQICVYYLDENCYVNLEEAVMGELFRCARDVPGRESTFKPRSGILPRYRRRERI